MAHPMSPSEMLSTGQAAKSAAAATAVSGLTTGGSLAVLKFVDWIDYYLKSQ